MKPTNLSNGSLKKKILFILSTSYAGSHFCSLLLGSHSKTLHIGEIALLDTSRFENGDCYFQSGNILEGLGQKDLPQIHELIFSRADPSVEILVDASKKLSWAEACLDRTENYEKRYLHLIRDPRALVRRSAMMATPAARRKMRWKITRKFPTRAFSIWQAPDDELWTYQWLIQNQKITDFVRKRQLNAELVTYRDLATNQSAEVARLMRWLGLDFEPAQLEYWAKPHIGSQKRTYDWVKEKKTQHFDLRWQKELTPETQKRIADNTRVRQYLESIQIQFTPDGLTRTGDAYK